MPHAPSVVTAHSPGFGLGLRTTHYADFLATRQPLDWLEIITDNYLVDGGKPLVTLDTIRRDYPMVMHGVAMSLGAPGGVDVAYLRKVKALADRIDPLWISDHLCWIGTGPQQLHDLYPLPYTEEAARHLIAQICRAQDVLQRRLVVENVSSYIEFGHSAATEWEFLRHVANAADCLLLVDINNIYVSSVNHGFDALAYLHGLPRQRVQQFHLAGHSDEGSHIVDTHDHPVAEPVWALYRHACALFGPVATMIERDDHIPPLPELLAELDIARSIAAAACPVAQPPPAGRTFAWPAPAPVAAPALQAVQQQLAGYILGAAPDAALPVVRSGPHTTGRLAIYHHAYRARLAEVLSDTFEKTTLYMGSDAFNGHARDFAVLHPPSSRSLNHYGAGFVDYLSRRYPHNPELSELARLDWDLRSCFDGPDLPAMTPATAAADPANAWLAQAPALHAGVVLREVTSNVVSIWNAIDSDNAVPAPVRKEVARTLAVWRKELQPHFRILEPAQAAWLHRMRAGASILQLCEAFADTSDMPDLATFGRWLAEWLDDGILAAAPAPQGVCQEAREAVVS